MRNNMTDTGITGTAVTLYNSMSCGNSSGRQCANPPSSQVFMETVKQTTRPMAIEIILNLLMEMKQN